MKLIYVLISLAVLVGIVIVVSSNSSGPGLYDDFAKCLGDEGFKFYGAYWCSHCNQQKELFGASASKLPYIECSLPKQAGQTAICTQAGITSYPTWELPSGKRVSGVMSLQELSGISGCPLNATA